MAGESNGIHALANTAVASGNDRLHGEIAGMSFHECGVDALAVSTGSGTQSTVSTGSLVPLPRQTLTHHPHRHRHRRRRRRRRRCRPAPFSFVATFSTTTTGFTSTTSVA